MYVMLALALVACNDASVCGPTSATVDRVIDGDTIVLATGEKVRYLLIDAPETPNGHADCFGSNATTFNRDLVEGKTIDLAYDARCTDTYGRLLAYVSIDDTDVNALMVERGDACVLFIPPDGETRRSEFQTKQADAKARRAGLWGACDPLPPAC
jgi:micrococcal nuclease